MIRRSGDAVFSLHRTQGDDERGFLGLTSKPRSTVSPSLASKPVASDFPVWASKPVASDFPVWASKPAVAVWFGPQNQVGYGLSVVPQN
jgi:hypothetical protein